jgi:hypothetical protein
MKSDVSLVVYYSEHHLSGAFLQEHVETRRWNTGYYSGNSPTMRRHVRYWFFIFYFLFFIFFIESFFPQEGEI